MPAHPPPDTVPRNAPETAGPRTQRRGWPIGWVTVTLLLCGLTLGGCRREAGGPAQGVAPELQSSEETPQDPTPATPTPRFPAFNLIFVSFDALQAAHVGAWGGRPGVTPTLDALARRSCLFRKAYSVASWNVPASMSWFTGVYPSEHRMTNKFAVYNANTRQLADLRELSPQLATLAGVLRQSGYATGGFTGNAGVHGGFGFAEGFDVYYSESGRFGGFESSIPRALEWLRAHRDRKFILFLHGYDCHGQFAPEERLDDRFVDSVYDRRYLGTPREQKLLREAGLEQGRLNLREADVAFWRGVYDEKVQRADTRFREFLAALEKLQLDENTLLIVAADHGTEPCEHDRLDHGFTLYNELLHVPLIMKLPGQSAGLEVADRVSTIDLFPTILDLLDVSAGPASGQLRGSSLAPALTGARVARSCFSETDYREYTFKRSILRPTGLKLILTLESNEREVYDLTVDPGETTNLAPSHPALADELESELRTHFRSLGHPLENRQWKIGLNPVYSSQESP